MSNSLAIAAVTATLKNLLSKVTDPLPGDPLPDPGDLSDAWVSTKPPDKARDPQEPNSQLNLFLYQTQTNAAFRNYPMPGATADGEDGQPPLPLDLYYLVSAYGRGGDDMLAHRMMGRAMTILHDNADLAREDIRAALAGNDLYRQVERVRIVPHQLNIEELSKLWTTFQTAFRLSASYHVSVVLIDSPKPAIAPLPVLQRGPLTPFGTDTGAMVHPDLTHLAPTISALTLPKNQPSARIGSGAAVGDVLVLDGTHLSGASVQATFQHASQAASNTLTVPAASVTPTQVKIQLPGALADQAKWPAGPWSLSLLIDGRPSNPVYFTLAPRIAPSATPPDVNGDIVVTAVVSPWVWPDQRVSLLFDDAEVRAPSLGGIVGSIAFPVLGPSTGTHKVRLRVDGVDSLLILDYSAKVPIYDPSQQVTV